jgi:hypothetical protein
MANVGATAIIKNYKITAFAVSCKPACRTVRVKKLCYIPKSADLEI